MFLVPGIWGGPRCCQFLTLHKKQHDRRGGWGGWGGVGWDNSVICCTFSCTCTHTSCCCTFSCTCTHTSCYAAVRSHALAHIRHATPLYVLMHLHTYVMLRRCTFSCTCTHTSCDAAVRSHALAHIVGYLVASQPCRKENWTQHCTNTRTAGFGDITTCRKTWMSPKLCISLDVSLPPLEKWACQSAISRMINIQMMMMMMMMMMMKLLLMLKFRFSAFCGPPCKMFEKWQQRGPPQMPGTMFLYKPQGHRDLWALWKCDIARHIIIFIIYFYGPWLPLQTVKC